MIPPAAKLIQNEAWFKQGSLARTIIGRPCGLGPEARPVYFDCLGALIWAYRHVKPEVRHEVAKRVFSACDARFHHKHLGKLVWDDAFQLLKDCGA